MFHLEKVQWYLKYKKKFSINRKVGWKFEHILPFQEDVIRMRNSKLYEYLVKYDNYLSNISFVVVVDVFCLLFALFFFFVLLVCLLAFCYFVFCFLFFVFFTVFCVLFCWFSFVFVAELYST